jgi:hypothetical protein
VNFVADQGAAVVRITCMTMADHRSAMEDTMTLRDLTLIIRPVRLPDPLPARPEGAVKAG